MRILITGAVAAFVAATLFCSPTAAQATKAAAPSYTNQQVPFFADGKDAKMVRLRDLNGYGYMEFMLVGSEPYQGKIMGTVYNTTSLNTTPADPKNSAPPALVKKLDAAQLAKQYGVSRVWINPPRTWLLDWIDIPAGAKRDFGGIEALWCAEMAMPRGEWKPFTSTTIARRSEFGFNKGTTVYLLDDPKGTTWIMKSVSPSVSPENTYQNLSTVGQRHKLPPGWKARSVTLDKELILVPTGGVARILRDDLDNVYDVTGKGYSNFTP